MKLSEFKNILDTTKYPVAYTKFDETPKLPYIVYYCSNPVCLYADGGIYYSSERVVVELYTNKKDISTESLLEKTLLDADIVYDKTGEGYNDAEKLYQIIYEMEI